MDKLEKFVKSEDFYNSFFDSTCALLEKIIEKPQQFFDNNRRIILKNKFKFNKNDEIVIRYQMKFNNYKQLEILIEEIEEDEI